MTERIVIVTGGRDYGDYATVSRELTERRAERVIQGGASGADAMAKAWAVANGVPCETFAANWQALGKRAGPIRNLEMANRGASLQRSGASIVVLAFPGGRGTADMCRVAESVGLNVVRVVAEGGS